MMSIRKMVWIGIRGTVLGVALAQIGPPKTVYAECTCAPKASGGNYKCNTLGNGCVPGSGGCVVSCS